MTRVRLAPLCALLRKAYREQDWQIVKDVIVSLEALAVVEHTDALGRQSSGTPPEGKRFCRVCKTFTNAEACCDTWTAPRKTKPTEGVGVEVRGSVALRWRADRRTFEADLSWPGIEACGDGRWIDVALARAFQAAEQSALTPVARRWAGGIARALLGVGTPGRSGPEPGDSDYEDWIAQGRPY